MNAGCFAAFSMGFASPTEIRVPLPPLNSLRILSRDSGTLILRSNCFTVLSRLAVLFCYCYMHRTLTDPELLRCLPHRSLRFNDIITDIHSPLFNIILQRESPCIDCCYKICRGKRAYTLFCLNIISYLYYLITCSIFILHNSLAKITPRD